MKKFFSTKKEGLRKLKVTHKTREKIFYFILGVVLIGTLLYIVGHAYIIYKAKPNPEDYKNYEQIVQKISQMKIDEIRKFEVPKNMKIKIDTNSIIVRNKISYYSVKGLWKNDELVITKHSGIETFIIKNLVIILIAVIIISVDVVILILERKEDEKQEFGQEEQIDKK